MPPTCTVQNSPDRLELEALAEKGVGARALERHLVEKYPEGDERRLSRSALHRHVNFECTCRPGGEKPSTPQVVEGFRFDSERGENQLGTSLFNFHLEMYGLVGKPQEELEGIFRRAVATHQPQSKCMNQLGLIEDMKVYLQNRVLGRITGGKVPHRQPTDPTVPRIVIGRDGRVEIVEGSDQKMEGSEENAVKT